jgi:hypothetical protein
MRSIIYLQPGERRSCVGCHEPRGITPINMQGLLALQREPSTIQAGPDGTLPLSYTSLVQPVLDKHCIRCHDGKSGDLKSQLVLTGESVKTFSKSYESLREYVRWYEWGGKSITQIVTRPGHIGADQSPLLKILKNPLHKKHVQMSKDELQRIYIWLDANAPFYGTYEPEQQLAQKDGQAVSPPSIQ